jgi:hypothetical protein
MIKGRPVDAVAAWCLPCGSAASTSTVERIACAYVGPFNSSPACILSLLKAAVASFTSVTWYPCSIANRPVVSMHVLASRPITMTLAILCFSSTSRSVFAKPLGPQCSLTTNRPTAARNQDAIHRPSCLWGSDWSWCGFGWSQSGSRRAPNEGRNNERLDARLADTSGYSSKIIEQPTSLATPWTGRARRS